MTPAASALACLLALAACALAQPPATADGVNVHRLTQDLEQEPDPRSPRADDLRRLLLAVAPDDPRSALWQAGLASSALEEHPRANASVLVGVPAQYQRQRARESAARALRLADSARRRALAAVEQLQSQQLQLPAQDEQQHAGIERTLTLLVDDLLAARLPLLETRAGLMLLRASDDIPHENELARIVGVLERLDATAADAEPGRLALLAATVLRADPGDPERALAAAQHILRETDADALPPTLALIVRAISGDNDKDPDAALLAAEIDAAAQLARAQTTLDPGARQALLARAASTILEPAQGPLGPALTPGVRAGLRDKVAEICDEITDFTLLPPDAALAHGIVLAGREGFQTPAERRFRHARTHADAEPRTRADATWELAVILSDRAQPAAQHECVGLLLTFVREFSGDARAPDAAQHALDRARALAAAERAGDPERALLLAALLAKERLVGTASLASIDALQLAALETGSPERFDLARVLVLVEQTGEPERAAAVLDAACARGLGSDQAHERVRAARVVAGLDGVLLDGLAVGTIAHAAGVLEGVDAGSAVRLYERALANGLDDASTRTGLARALIASGDEPRAVEELTGVIASFDQSTPERPPAFWEAWATLLKLHTREHELSVSDARRVGAQVRALRLIDDGLGGSPWSGLIAAAELRALRVVENAGRAGDVETTAVPTD